MLNIVVPMAGRGKRFSDAGYKLPKPLIPIHGEPMIRLVIENLRPKCDHRFIFLLLEEHAGEFGIDDRIRKWTPNAQIIYVSGVTEGAACTVLLARDLIDNDAHLMIANCDQYIDVDIDRYLNSIGQADGLIMTMKADDNKWSFVRFDDNGKVVEVIEKVVVSDEATVGIYNFRSGHQFVKAADKMIEKELRVGNEFYVAPVYNQMIAHGATIKCFNVGTVNGGMYGIGVPADLENFISLPISKQAVAEFSST